MKKIYLSLSILALGSQISLAQLSLTKAANEPVVGDMTMMQQYDSTTAIPKSIGAGQNWNFTSLMANTNVQGSTYTTTASTPSASIFPGATISEDQGSGNYTHYKSTSTTFEYQGIQFPGAVINFSNTGIFATWPINFGYNGTDPFSGSTTTGTVTASINGTINVIGSGTGTVVMPGGLILNNCLQLINIITFTNTIGSNTQAQIQKEYQYFHSSNKFPVLTVQYQTSITGTVVTKNVSIEVNTAIVAGIKANMLNADFSVFPNPTSDMINIVLDNNSNKEVKLSLTNMFGQTVKTENLGTESSINAKLNVNGLPRGIYFMNVNVGNASSVKKVVVE